MCHFTKCIASDHRDIPRLGTWGERLDFAARRVSTARGLVDGKIMSLEKEVRRARRGAGGEAAAVLLAGRREIVASHQPPAHTSPSPTHAAAKREEFAVSTAEDPGVVEVLREEVKRVSLERDALAARIGREGEVAAEAVRAELEAEIAEMRSRMTPPIPPCMRNFCRSRSTGQQNWSFSIAWPKKQALLHIHAKSTRAHAPFLLIFCHFQGAYLRDEGTHRVFGGRFAKGCLQERGDREGEAGGRSRGYGFASEGKGA